MQGNFFYLLFLAVHKKVRNGQRSSELSHKSIKVKIFVCTPLAGNINDSYNEENSQISAPKKAGGIKI